MRRKPNRPGKNSLRETIERHRALGVEDEPEKKVVEDMDADLDDLNFDDED